MNNNEFFETIMDALRDKYAGILIDQIKGKDVSRDNTGVFIGNIYIKNGGIFLCTNEREVEIKDWNDLQAFIAEEILKNNKE